MSNLSHKVLVVEDEASLLNALKEKMAHEGIEVLEASDGAEGLEIVLREMPKVVLLDILMPKMGGIEMLKKLRENPDCKDIKVIIFTNLTDNENIASAIDLGSNDYLIKSNWSLEDIIAKIKDRLN